MNLASRINIYLFSMFSHWNILLNSIKLSIENSLCLNMQNMFNIQIKMADKMNCIFDTVEFCISDYAK